VAAYVPDLMDRSKLSDAGVSFVRTPEELIDMDADVVVVDLSRPRVLDILPRLAGRRVIGFGSHVDTELLDAAKAAGCTEVLTRSRFFADPAVSLSRRPTGR
jgi:hypothetical protein